MLKTNKQSQWSRDIKVHKEVSCTSSRRRVDRILDGSYVFNIRTSIAVQICQTDKCLPGKTGLVPNSQKESILLQTGR